jgi:hypothetical protein
MQRKIMEGYMPAYIYIYKILLVVGRVHASQAQGPEFKPQNHLKNKRILWKYRRNLKEKAAGW